MSSTALELNGRPDGAEIKPAPHVPVPGVQPDVVEVDPRRLQPRTSKPRSYSVLRAAEVPRVPLRDSQSDTSSTGGCPARA